MTKAQALKWAEGIWGKTAYVEDRGKKTSTEHVGRYVIGVEVMVILPMRCVKGHGKSWQAAADSVKDREKRTRF